MKNALISIAGRNVWRNKRRYSFLIGGLALGAGILILLNSIFTAMIFNTEKKASVYYGGDASLIGFFRIRDANDSFTYGRAEILNRDFLVKAVKDTIGQDTHVAFRTVPRPENLTVYNEDGASMRQRLIIGVDFPAEAELLARLGPPASDIATLGGTKSVLVSRIVADHLNLQLNSRVTIVTETVSTQKNSDTFRVGGIFDDSSVFGATSIYMDRASLNQLRNQELDFADEMTLYSPDRRIGNGELDRLQSALAQGMQTFPRLLDKSDNWQDGVLKSSAWEHEKYILIGLAAHLSQIHDRIVALELVSALLIAILMVIVILGVFNTFRLLVYERYQEIGTLRALGMKRRSVLGIFLMESLIISGIGFVLGFALSWILIEIGAQLDYSSLKGFEIFLENDTLRGRVVPSDLLYACLVICLAGTVGAWIPARRASRIQPAQALRKE